MSCDAGEVTEMLENEQSSLKSSEKTIMLNIFNNFKRMYEFRFKKTQVNENGIAAL